MAKGNAWVLARTLGSGASEAYTKATKEDLIVRRPVWSRVAIATAGCRFCVRKGRSPRSVILLHRAEPTRRVFPQRADGDPDSKRIRLLIALVSSL